MTNLPPQFQAMRERHVEMVDSDLGLTGWCAGCINDLDDMHPCAVTITLDALEKAVTFISHVAYDTWSSGDLLIEAKEILDDIEAMGGYCRHRFNSSF